MWKPLWSGGQTKCMVINTIEVKNIQLVPEANSKSVCPLASKKHTWHREAIRFIDSSLATEDQNESKYCYNYNVRIHKRSYRLY